MAEDIDEIAYKKNVDALLRVLVRILPCQCARSKPGWVARPERPAGLGQPDLRQLVQPSGFILEVGDLEVVST